MARPQCDTYSLLEVGFSYKQTRGTPLHIQINHVQVAEFKGQDFLARQCEPAHRGGWMMCMDRKHFFIVLL